MKVLATFALLLACSSVSTAQRTPLGELFNVYPKNLAQNEVFQEESWKGLNEEVTKINHWDLWRVELGYGHQYNHEWGNQRVVLLDVGYNNKIGYKFDFEKGHYYVAIDYAPDEHVEPASSKFSIYWGSWLYLMKTYYPWQSKGLFTMEMIVYCTGDKYRVKKLQFAAAGTEDNHGTTFSNLRIYKIKEDRRWVERHYGNEKLLYYGYREFGQAYAKNMIRNSDMSDVKVQKKGLTIRVVAHDLEEWDIFANGDLILASVHNRKWPNHNDYIATLKYNTHIMYTTDFIGVNRNYSLSFDYAAPDVGGSSQYWYAMKVGVFSVTFNGKTVATIRPDTCEVIRIYIKVQGKQGLNTLNFINQGPIDDANQEIGSGFDNVHVHQM